MVTLYQPPSFKTLQRRLSRATRQQIGVLGELTAAAQLMRAGYAVSVPRPGEQRGDLRVVLASGEICNLEVKTARAGADGKWRFRLSKPGHTSIQAVDVVLLLAIVQRGRVVPFVIPADTIRKRTHICITSNPQTYAGMFAQYRVNRIHL